MPDVIPKFFVGQSVRLWGVFEQDGAFADPSEVTIMHRDPSANEASEVYNGGAGNVVKSATGKYYLDLTLDEAGTWAWRVKGATITATYENQIIVTESLFNTP